MKPQYLYWSFCCCLLLQWGAPVRAQAPDFIVENGRLVLPGVILFDTADQVTIDTETNKILDAIALYMNKKNYISTLRIEGHFERAESIPDGQQRSEKRALSVTQALVKRGIACDRLIAVGFGSTKPIAPNGSVEGQAKNRRVEIRPAAMHKRPIGGLPIDGGGKIAANLCQ
jgi:OOP family OmpA-OmpF porin